MFLTIPIDHGNRDMKTLNHVFPSSYVESSTLAVAGDATLKCDGVEYTLNDMRLPQLNDKTVNDRYFILTLFAIGKELADTPRLQRPLASDELVHIELLIGLPLQHFRELKMKFIAYFADRGEINFTFNKRDYSIVISDIHAYPQGYAAYIASRSQLMNSKAVSIIDIGGYTVDCLSIIDNKPILESCRSLEIGVNTLFQTINDRVRAKAKKPIPEKIIECILKRDSAALIERRNQVDLIVTSARIHVSNLISELSQYFDLEEDSTIFVGGGSILLKQQILDAGAVKKPSFINNVHANAQGYLKIRDMEKRLRRVS